MWRITIEYHSSFITVYLKTAAWEVLLKLKQHGTGLTQRVSVEDGSSLQWALSAENGLNVQYSIWSTKILGDEGLI